MVWRTYICDRPKWIYCYHSHKGREENTWVWGSYIVHAGGVLASTQHLVVFGGDVLTLPGEALAWSRLRLVWKRAGGRSHCEPRVVSIDSSK